MDLLVGVGDITISQILDPYAVARFNARSHRGKWGCREWNARQNRGYGVFTLHGDARQLVAHRVAWMIQHGTTIPWPLVVDHLCCNTACVNAEHLEVVTREENTYRRDHPPEGWIQVPNKVKYGVRRKRHPTSDELQRRRLGRRSAKRLPPPSVIESGPLFYVLWHERDSRTQLAQPRSRRFGNRSLASAFAATIKAA